MPYNLPAKNRCIVPTMTTPIDINSVEYAEVQHAECVLAISKARQAQSYSRSSGGNNTSKQSVNYDQLCRDRDYWAGEIRRRTNGNVIPVYGVIPPR